MRQRATAAAVLLAALLLYAAAAILGPGTTDPVRLFAGLGLDFRPSWLPGFGTIDPNMGFTAFALGRRAVQDWFAGTLPLWNPYEGLGQPLLGEVQSAALFPPTVLLLLPHGQVWEQALLQVVAGAGTFALLLRLGLVRAAALFGGVLFELNGVFAWLRNAIYNPVAFLPWLLFVIEALSQAADARLRWRERLPLIGLGAIAGALALYAGFPETVYFYSLLIGLWVLVRIAGLARRRLAFLADLAGIGAWAALIGLPLLLAFVSFLPDAEVGGHKGDLFKTAVLPPEALLATFLPYVYGPIFAAPLDQVRAVFSNVGGYWGMTPALFAVVGLAVRRDSALAWLMALWIVLAVAVSQGVPVVHDVFMRVPLAAIASYARYMNAGWLLCGTILAAMFVDRVALMSPASRRHTFWLAVAVMGATLALAIVAAWPTLGELWNGRLGLRLYAIVSSIAAACLVAGFAMAMRRRHAGILMSLAIAEAFVAFLMPLASNPHVGGLDRPLIAFLRQNAGLQRVATVAGDVLMPNFGSAFGIATINYDDLPVPARTGAFVAQLDPRANPVMFRPTASPPNSPAEILVQLPGYRAAAVRYLLAPPDFMPPGSLPEVFRSWRAAVYEVPGAAPYAEAPACDLVIHGRDRLEAQCEAPARLLRRELFLDGWRASVNGRPAPIRLAADVFQAIDLPAGASTIRFEYAPTGVRPAIALAVVALILALAAACSGPKRGPLRVRSNGPIWEET